MSKNRLSLHIAAIMAVAFFAFLAISSAQQQKSTYEPKPVEAPVSTPRPVDNTEKVISSKTDSQKANVDSIPAPAQKPFDALGLVFATSVTKYDENGNQFDGQENIVLLLLREAQKLGGNDILNLRIDTNTTMTQTRVNERMVVLRTVTTTGSALAIKYKN